jgi:hypothetical protein
MSPSPNFSLGDPVIISGLVHSAHLNGRHGAVTMIPKAKGRFRKQGTRYGIQVDEEEKAVLVKLSNLTLATPPNEGSGYQIGDDVVLHGLVTAKLNEKRV